MSIFLFLYNKIKVLTEKREFDKYVFLLLFLVGLIIYSNSLSIPVYHYDDKATIVLNPFIRDLGNIKRILLAFNTRFIVGLSFSINYWLGGLNIFGYRVVNFLIHILTSFCVFRLCSITFQTPSLKDKFNQSQSRLIAFAASLFFISHPLQTESVNLLTQRYTSLASLFYIASILLYALSRLRSSKKYFVFSFVFVICAMLSKEFAFTIPFMMVLYELCFFSGSGDAFKKRCRIILPFFLTLIIIPSMLIYTPSSVTHTARIAKGAYVSQESEGIIGKVDNITRTQAPYSRKDYFLTQLNVMRTYLRMLFLPINQNLDYDYPITRSFMEIKTVLSALLLLAMLLFAWKFLPQYRLVSFGIFWFFIALSVESSFIPIGYVINEHRIYLSMAGFSFALSYLLYYFSRSEKIFVSAIVIIVLSFSVATYRRNRVWRNEIILWEDTVLKSPHHSRAHANLGIAYKMSGDFDSAVGSFKRATELDPRNVTAYTNLGHIYNNMGDVSQARNLFVKSMDIDPYYYLAPYSLGHTYYVERNYREAVKHFKKTLEADPTCDFAYHSLGVAYYKSGDTLNAQRQVGKLKEFKRFDLVDHLEGLLASDVKK